MFDKILIANRGEIALRIIRACQEMGIKTVAIYSVADLNEKHVVFADQAVCVGREKSIESYLNTSQILSAAVITGAKVIHPGYGFLSENPDFAEACASCKITFIGPTAKMISQIGDKISARETVKKAGIPILPGTELLKDIDEAKESAKKLGYPVIIKSAGGGGGRGMRVIYTEEDLLNAFSTAQTEVKQAANISDIYLEKFIEEAKHVEFQILADNFGHIVHLGERDCSIQRRFQKLIEESPCSILPPRKRKKMEAAAIKAVKAVKYRGVGTIEFLYDITTENFYFIEMNTRIQVEHPVTEAVTGIDIVKEQIRIAAGEPLKFRQNAVQFNGHAIECRINAEDPEKFMPCPGIITRFELPGGQGVRIDTAAYTGCTISPYYDSLIAKLIIHGHDRNEAICKMNWALNEFAIKGIKTTIPFHKKVLNHPAFLEGKFCTNFINKYIEKK